MKIFKKPHLIFLTLIILFSLFVRILWLDQAPKGLLIDEAHFGYIAQSLLETGRDEHGHAWPLVFQGFGDQKLPLQAYLMIPFVKFLGLNVWAVRLPSAIVGSILPLVIYWLLREIKLDRLSALFGAMITALSPWPFIMSRFAYEANLGLLFFTLGLIGLVKFWKNQSNKWALLSGILFAITWYSYVVFRPVTIILLVTYVFYLIRRHQLSLKLVATLFLPFLLMVSPFFLFKVKGTAGARLMQVGIFSDQGLVLEINENRTFCGDYLPKLVCYGVWNKATVYGKELLQRYTEVYSPEFLITTGNETNRYQTLERYGQFYLLLWPLIILGFAAMFFQLQSSKLEKEAKVLLWLGLVFTPIPAIMVGDPQKIRLAPLLPFLIIFSVLGLKLVRDRFRSVIFRKSFLASLLVLLFAASGAYFVDYFTVHTHKHDYVYQSYVPELFARIEQLKTDETQIYLKPFFSDPIMAYAFYQKISPQHYQENVELGAEEDSGFRHAVGLDNYLITDVNLDNLSCQLDTTQGPILYVTNQKYDGIRFVDRISSENGALYYAYIYDVIDYSQTHPGACQ